jgi:Mrp family chromosome partitioning ATPase
MSLLIINKLLKLFKHHLEITNKLKPLFKIIHIMSRLVMPLTKIVITGNKGGTGKTTIAALLTEYLNYQNQKVQLIDTDPNQALQA